MAVCKHKNVDWIRSPFEKRVCLDCGELLSLGPSNDKFDGFAREIDLADSFAVIVSFRGLVSTNVLDGCERDAIDGRYPGW